MTKIATFYRPGTASSVRRILESARLSREQYRSQGTILRLIFGNPATGESSLEECDVVGFVGRTTGQSKCPILLEPLRNNASIDPAWGGRHHRPITDSENH